MNFKICGYIDVNPSQPIVIFKSNIISSFCLDMYHQMITITMEGVDPETKIEFLKYMDIFKSHGKQGDEGFYMELSPNECDEILRSSTQKVTQQTQFVLQQTTQMVSDHIYSQQGEEECRSPSPPRIGFAGPIIK